MHCTEDMLKNTWWKQECNTEHLYIFRATEGAHIEIHLGTWAYKKIIIVLTLYCFKHMPNFNSFNTINIHNQGEVFGSPCIFIDIYNKKLNYISIY